MIHPDTAHLHDGSELGPLQLVEVVVELVGALDELGLVLFDGQLHLHDDFVLVQDVHQDIFIALVESVLDSDDFYVLWLSAADSLDLFV